MSTVQYRKWAEEWGDWEDIQRCASDNGLIWSEEQCKDFLDEHEYELAEKMKESSYELAEELICEIVAIEEDEAEDEEYDFDDDDDSQDSCTISPESYEFLENRLGNQYYHNRNIRRKPNTGSQYLIDDSMHYENDYTDVLLMKGISNQDIVRHTGRKLHAYS